MEGSENRIKLYMEKCIKAQIKPENLISYNIQFCFHKKILKATFLLTFTKIYIL